MQDYFRSGLETQHIYVLYGLGGVGKTQIALKLIELLRACFSDLFFVDASSSETITLHLKKIATSKKIGTSPEEAKEWLVSKKQQWLIFFDNADDPKLDLNEYLPKCNHGNIIITSRNPELRTYAAAHGSYTQVTNMEEEEAVHLLLTHATQDNTSETRALAGDIVKTLHFLPLAIIQAGAFIARSSNLKNYLGLYKQNKTKLLSEKPVQSPESYAWTVYTTWEISFERLSSLARQLLQLCSLLHYDGISEFIFENASKYTFPLWGPSQHELKQSINFLHNFQTPTASWDSLRFTEIMNEIGTYSLLSYDPVQESFSMHPLVHEWCCSKTTNQPINLHCITGILGMCIGNIAQTDMQVASVQLQPHLDSISEMGGNMIEDFDRLFAFIYYEAGNYGKAKHLEEQVLQRCKAQLGDADPQTVAAMASLAVTHRRLGALQEAKQFEEEVLEKRQALWGSGHPDTLSAMENLAATHFQLGAFYAAKNLEENVLKKQRELLGDEHLHILPTIANVAAIYCQLGSYQKAKNLQEEVLIKHQVLLGDKHPKTMFAMANLAVIHHQLGAYQEAKHLQEAALATERALLGGTHPDTLTTMGNLAATYYKLGAYKEAKLLAEEALQKQRALLGDTHPDTLKTMESLLVIYQQLNAYEEAKLLKEEIFHKPPAAVGGVSTMKGTALEEYYAQPEAYPNTTAAIIDLVATYCQLGNYEAAKHPQEEVVKSHRAQLGDAHPLTMAAVVNLAVIHHQLGAYHEAKNLEEEVLKYCKAQLGDMHQETLTAMSNLADTQCQLGAYQEAKHVQQEVLSKCRALLGEEHRDTLTAMGCVAATCCKLNQFQEAKELGEIILQGQRKKLGAHHPDTLEAMRRIAATYRQLGQDPEAEDLEQQLKHKETD